MANIRASLAQHWILRLRRLQSDPCRLTMRTGSGTLPQTGRVALKPDRYRANVRGIGPALGHIAQWAGSQPGSAVIIVGLFWHRPNQYRPCSRKPHVTARRATPANTGPTLSRHWLNVADVEPMSASVGPVLSVWRVFWIGCAAATSNHITQHKWATPLP